ncbi:MAG: glycosyltransferase family 4 protein, partial [Acidobacteriota bacterium]|nr:glycosyltransferase family 4 protein [Acidobacteriota bacterium]
MTADAVGGVWQYSVDLIEALSSYGCEILLSTLGPRPSPSQRDQLSRVSNVHLAESDFKLEWMDNPWGDVDRSSQWLLSLEREFKPDVVHLNGYSLASASFQAPVISVAHSCVYSWWTAVHGSEPGPEWLEYKYRISRGLSASAAVVAPSQFMAEAVTIHYGSRAEKTRVIHNFSSSPQTRPPEKQPYVLAGGRMWDEAKNLALLQSVADELQWTLHIA